MNNFLIIVAILAIVVYVYFIVDSLKKHEYKFAIMVAVQFIMMIGLWTILCI